MANTVYQRVADLPEAIRTVLREVSYNRVDIGVEAHETVSRAGASGEGRKRFVAIVDLATSQHRIEWGSWGGANINNPSNAVDLDTEDHAIPPNVAVVTGLIGGVTYATLTVRPDAMARMLPSLPTLSPREQWVLWCFKALNPRGRKHEFERRGITPSDAELDALAARGLLKRSRNGATQITTEGRNALVPLGLGSAEP